MNLRRVVVAAAVATASISGATFAWASFVDAESATQSLDTATLEPPSNVQLSGGTCTAGVADSITVSWTKSPSAWADGYEILGSLIPGGPYLISQHVAGRDTESAVVGGLAFQTTYHFVVKSTKGNWRSEATTETSRTTRSALCL
jgi:hypothetical protein